MRNHDIAAPSNAIATVASTLRSVRFESVRSVAMCPTARFEEGRRSSIDTFAIAMDSRTVQEPQREMGAVVAREPSYPGVVADVAQRQRHEV